MNKTDREIAEAALPGNMRSATDALIQKALFDERFTPRKVHDMLLHIEELEAENELANSKAIKYLLQRCGYWGCNGVTDNKCFEDNHGLDVWCPSCIGHAIVDPGFPNGKVFWAQFEEDND